MASRHDLQGLMNGSATDRRRHTCIRLAMWCGRAAVNASVDCLRCQAAPTASTSPLSRGLCRAHRWVHSRDQIPGRSARRFVRVLEHVTILLSPGSQDREPFGEEPPGVWTVICPGKQHFANLLDSSRPARGLLHTEEVVSLPRPRHTVGYGIYWLRRKRVTVAVDR